MARAAPRGSCCAATATAPRAGPARRFAAPRRGTAPGAGPSLTATASSWRRPGRRGGGAGGRCKSGVGRVARGGAGAGCVRELQQLRAGYVTVRRPPTHASSYGSSSPFQVTLRGSCALRASISARTACSPAGVDAALPAKVRRAVRRGMAAGPGAAGRIAGGFARHCAGLLPVEPASMATQMIYVSVRAVQRGVYSFDGGISNISENYNRVPALV